MKILNYKLSNLNQKEREIFESIFDINEVRSSFSSSFDGSSIESNYIRMYGFRYWDNIEIDNLKEKVDRFNSLVKSVKMEVTGYEDYEIEYDGDRSYPASFTFSIIPNENK
jgi:hypothetical protein